MKMNLVRSQDINKILESRGYRRGIKTLIRRSLIAKKRLQRQVRLWAQVVISDDYVARLLG